MRTTLPFRMAMPGAVEMMTHGNFDLGQAG